MTRIALGFLLGGVPAIISAFDGHQRAHPSGSEAARGGYLPVPKISLLPLIIVVLGIGEESKCRPR